MRKDIGLKQCPFCGGKAVVGSPDMQRRTNVFCTKCYASSGWNEQEKAIENWNSRTND